MDTKVPGIVGALLRIIGTASRTIPATTTLIAIDPTRHATFSGITEGAAAEIMEARFAALRTG